MCFVAIDINLPLSFWLFLRKDFSIEKVNKQRRKHFHTNHSRNLEVLIRVTDCTLCAVPYCYRKTLPSEEECAQRADKAQGI